MNIYEYICEILYRNTVAKNTSILPPSHAIPHGTGPLITHSLQFQDLNLVTRVVALCKSCYLPEPKFPHPLNTGT